MFEKNVARKARNIAIDIFWKRKGTQNHQQKMEEKFGNTVDAIIDTIPLGYDFVKNNNLNIFILRGYIPHFTYYRDGHIYLKPQHHLKWSLLKKESTKVWQDYTKMKVINFRNKRAHFSVVLR